MDFQRRSMASPTTSHVNNQNTPAPQQFAEEPRSKKETKGDKPEGPKWLRYISVALLFSLTIIVVAVVGLIHYSGNDENRLVNTSDYQAVFLANDQVYFGKIKAVNTKYLDLQDIFYLNNQSSQGSSSTTSSSTNLQLVKLGCEVHGPYDEMVINTSQVEFWENLRSDGQVVKAIGTWQQQNPNGQTCSSSNSSSSTTQSTGTTGSSSTSSSSTGKQ